MLNLEWVTRKLLPAVIERRSITTKKNPASPKQQPSSSSSNHTEDQQHHYQETSPDPKINHNNSNIQTENNENNNNPYLGPDPKSVVPPPVFAAILDEALNVLKKGAAPSSLSSDNGNNKNKNIFSLDGDDGNCETNQSISSPCYEVFPEIILEEGFNKNHIARKVHTIGPIRGHSVPLAKMLLQTLTQAKEDKKPLPNFIFLGDTIDSGPCSIECLSIVLALFVAYHREREAIFNNSNKSHQNDSSSFPSPSSNTNANNVHRKNSLDQTAVSSPTSQSNQQQQLPGSTSSVTSSSSPLSGAPSSYSNAFLQTPNLQASSSSINTANLASSIPQIDPLMPASPNTQNLSEESSQQKQQQQQQQNDSVHQQSQKQQHQSPTKTNQHLHLFSTNPNPSFADGPLCIPLRGRHESTFPAPSKWTGTAQSNYRRLDDELSETFDPSLDFTPHALVKIIAKLGNIFSWMPVACVVRCRVKQPVSQQMVDEYYGRNTTTNFSTFSAGDDEDESKNDNNNNLIPKMTPGQSAANSFESHEIQVMPNSLSEEMNNHNGGDFDFFFEQNRIQQTSFICVPGGPSPCLLRYSNFADMKELVEGAANRVLRANMVAASTTTNNSPINNNKNNNKNEDVHKDSNEPLISPVHLPSAAKKDKEESAEEQQVSLSPPALTKNNNNNNTNTKFGSGRKNIRKSASMLASEAFAKEQQRKQDVQLLKDLATAEPYEDDEDRAATTTGILFSDNPDNTRDPGMCCFSTEAAALLLARSGIQSIVRGSSFTLQRIPVSAPNKIQKNVREFQEEQQQQQSSSVSSPSSSRSSSRRSSLSRTTSSMREREKQEYTVRPKASPYDPGFRMYRLPSHVKRAVQRGAIPNFGVCASPLSISQNNSVQDLSALAASAGTVGSTSSVGGSTSSVDGRGSMSENLDELNNLGSRQGSPVKTANNSNSNDNENNYNSDNTNTTAPPPPTSSLGSLDLDAELSQMKANYRIGSHSSSIGSSNASMAINSNFASGVNIQSIAAGAHTLHHLQQQILRQQQQQQDQENNNISTNSINFSSSSGQIMNATKNRSFAIQQQQQKQRKGSSANTFPFLPQVISLFSAPHFGNNLKSRNLGCLAVIQCAESKLSDEKNHQTQRHQRGAFVSLIQFEDLEPLMFAPLQHQKREQQITQQQQQQQQEEEVEHCDHNNDFEEEKQENDHKNNLPPQYFLNEHDEGLLKRLKRMCEFLKDKGQLHMLKKSR